MAAEAAPFLHEYFEELKNMAGEKMSAATPELAFDPEGQKAALQRAEDAKEKLKPLIEKSFDHHDSKKNGVLDAEEAAVFFSHVVAEQEAFLETFMSFIVLASLQPMMLMLQASLEGMDAEQRKKASLDMGEQVKKAVDGVRAEVAKMAEEYKANKSERDAAAFKVVDTSGDGTLQIGEVVAAFTPDTPLNEAFMKALGFEKNEPPADDAPDCAQQ